MKICIIGKYPPIQGGVSVRTYWTAHGLARLGHEVHVVTNAKEATPPFRLHMRPQDWARCEASYGAGSVTVLWSEPVDRSQSYIPMASPFITKLATIAATAHSAHRFDVIFSHYLEPYGVAGHLAAQMTGVPHVARMGGSDAGRLWRHPQFAALYDHVLRSADIVIAANVVAERAIARGVKPERIAAGGRYALPADLFTPQGPQLDPHALRLGVAADSDVGDAFWGDLSGASAHFGVYGKLGKNKGTFALLSALERLKRAGATVGLLALAHGRPSVEKQFRERVRELGLTDRVLQAPFLPHWRVPEFLRGCLAVCCLEQDFPIGFHSPIVPFEVLLCGGCLVGSTEVIRKLPNWQRLVHGYSCVAIEDVNDVVELSGKLAAIAANPAPAARVGLRGCDFAREIQDDTDFPQRLEHLLSCAAQRKPPQGQPDAEIADDVENSRFPLAQIAARALKKIKSPIDVAMTTTSATTKAIDLRNAKRILAALKHAVREGKLAKPSLAQAVAAEVAIAAAEDDASDRKCEAPSDPLFRLRADTWGVMDFDLATLTPIKFREFRVLNFAYDVSKFRGVRSSAHLPRIANARPSYIVVFAGEPSPNSLMVDGLTAHFLKFVDGRATVAEILRKLPEATARADPDSWARWVEDLFRLGLIGLQQNGGR